MEENWIYSKQRPPKDGEIILLPGMKAKYEVRGHSLYNNGRLAIPVFIIEKYKINE